jgi:hypothetical protein
MFKSIQHIKDLGYDPKTALYLYLFKIIDDDFEEETVGEHGAHETGFSMATGAISAIINCYSKRNLNVPKNLLLYFISNEKQYGSKYYSIQQQINICMKYQPPFPKYKEEVEKYLLLI